MFRNIRWRIAVPYVLLILLAMLTLVSYLSRVVREQYLANLQTQMSHEARWVGEATRQVLEQNPPSQDLGPLAQQYGKLSGSRVTIIRPDGVVLGDSERDRATLDNHLPRPEVQAALARGLGSSVRRSDSVGYDMLYVAVPVQAGDTILAVARVAVPLRGVDANVARLRQPFLVATLIATTLALLLAVVVAERIVRPIRWLTEVVQRMAAGDLGARLLPTTRDEVGTLTQAYNDMADHLRDSIGTLEREHARLATVLEHMADGVLITDSEGRVSLINPAAEQVLNTDAKAALGRSLAQLVRQHEIIDLWRRCRDQGEEQIELVEMGRHGAVLQAIASPLHGGEAHACLVILQDLTRVRRLETVRRDFISNISHELRTPLASLKALSDTLQDGALEDASAARHFLERIDTEVDALTQMVEELLELSRIESGRVPFRLASVAPAEIIHPPVERLREQARRAGLTLSVALSPALPPVLADLERAQQVVTNLVHNAIKFTPSGGSITVSAEAASHEVLFAIRDTGVGISVEDLPRIFERFYKTDQARATGGTGLGLSIAKHIIQSQGGRIWVESREGQGSTFRFTLPVAGPSATAETAS
jgi:two-component system, OmpR family, phosphate regulon sensor histidine kinase PhoR